MEAGGGGQDLPARAAAPRAVWQEGAATFQETDGGRAAGPTAGGNDEDEDTETGGPGRAAPSGPCLSRRQEAAAATGRGRRAQAGALLCSADVVFGGLGRPTLGKSTGAIFQRRLLTVSVSVSVTLW